MAVERSTEFTAIREVTLDQRPPAHRIAMTARKIVENHRAVSGPCQYLAGVAADVSGPARDQNRL
jgi:hypothetical protein